MKLQFETQVIEAGSLTPSSRSIKFLRPEGFEYLPGQFVILGVNGPNGEIKKPLSISSSPTEEHLEVAKRLTGHEFSNALNSLQPGDKVSFSGPYGGFTFRGEHEEVCMLCGGIGVTPLLSMIRFCTDTGSDSRILLIYSNRSEDEIPFYGELSRLEERNKRLSVVHTLTGAGPSWEGRRGRIDARMLQDLISDPASLQYYGSGPAKMVEAMLSLLREIGVPQDAVHKELFPGYE